MESQLLCSKYLFKKYIQDFGVSMDEMKMNRLMYFAQRESFLENGVPLFQGVFYAWKYGPVLKEIRIAYQSGLLSGVENEGLLPVCAKTILDTVYNHYSTRDSWSLSRLTHGEYSWRHARSALQTDESSECPINEEDILIDAKRIANRRKYLSQLRK